MIIKVTNLFDTLPDFICFSYYIKERRESSKIHHDYYSNGLSLGFFPDLIAEAKTLIQGNIKLYITISQNVIYWYSSSSYDGQYNNKNIEYYWFAIFNRIQ